MKTVQKVLQELDADKLIDTFLRDNPIEYDRNENMLDRTVRDIRDTVHNNLRRFINRLREMPITEPEEGHQGVLYAHRTMKEGFSAQAFNLVHLEELLELGTECENYAYEFTPQSEIMGFLIADSPMTQRYIYDLVADVLYEASFFGFEQEGLPMQKAKLMDSLEEVRSGNVESLSWEEVKAELETEDFSFDEESPDEEALRRAAWEAEWAYSRHSRDKELTAIREQYLAIEGERHHEHQ